ncbi:YopX family protein [Enterococcus faecalis]|uniref:YopX family protein n=1 Tax=Enterococcus faecalis TaxID=1351 RepID=UPI003CFEE198
MIPKFRAYVKEVNKTYEITEIDFGDEQLKTELGDWWSFDEVEIMQSTGLKDLNGVEIFEGDIVQYRDGEYSYLGIVKRDCYQFFIDGIEPDNNYDFIDVSNTFDGTSSLEIIGNIHENPELLEGTN